MLPIIPSRMLACPLLVCLALSLTLTAGSESGQEAEDELKAAVVLSFLRYGEWHAPLPPNAPLTVGVFGRAAFASVLRKSLEGKSANDHPLHVVELKPGADKHNCALVYFAEDKALDTKAALQTAAAAHILTIGEAREFLDWGGAIRLFVLDGHITFEFDLETLDRSGVNISSRLLRFGQNRNPKKGDRL
jgi:YfiR/HmsC-like